MNDDVKFMKEAIEASRSGNFPCPYGAVVVRNRRIIGRSDADTNIGKTIYRHAQMIAIEDALKKTTLMGNLKGCTLYSTIEPCMMCMEAICYSGLDRLVYGTNIESSNIYFHHLEDFSVLDIVKKINPTMEIVGGVCADEAFQVIKDYNKHIEDEDEKFIDIAIDLSSKAYYPFGAIVVRDGEIIGRSSDITPTKDTIFTHAELIAIESALQNIKKQTSRGDLHGCTLYTSCEPCMMCQEALLAEGISRVVYAATIEDSNEYFCNEFPVHIEDIVERAKSHTKIVAELHRDKAIEVLKQHGKLEQ